MNEERESSENSAATGRGVHAGWPIRRRVWLLLADKRGDNAQIEALAAALGDGFEIEAKRIVIHPRWQKKKPPVTPSLFAIDPERSDPLEAPWPDLVITAGRRLASVALYIKESSKRSKRPNTTRVVVLGKPRGQHAAFDLIVVADHYVVPPWPNVVRHAFPFTTLRGDRQERSALRFRERAEGWQKPVTAVLLGGPTGGLRFDEITLTRLFAALQKSDPDDRGTLFVTTSRRTPSRLLPLLQERLNAWGRSSTELYVYDESAPEDENPYAALLALADRFVVTSDSASMLVEIARLGRPLLIHPLVRDEGSFERMLVASHLQRGLDPTREAIPAGGVLARIFSSIGQPIHSRDMTAISRRLVREGLAGWTGEPWAQPAAWQDDEIEVVAERVRELLV